MARSLLLCLAAIGLGVAGAAMIAPAPLSADIATPAVDTRDFECFVLLQERRTGIAANLQLDAAQRAQIVNNLTIISAYYVGLMSRHPYDTVMTSLATAKRNIDAASAEQRDVFAGVCTNRYLTMVTAITASAQQAAQ